MINSELCSPAGRQFQSCFIAWVERFTTALRGVVAIDGKNVASFVRPRSPAGSDPDDLGGSAPQRLVLGQQSGRCAEKSNEDHGFECPKTAGVC